VGETCQYLIRRVLATRQMQTIEYLLPMDGGPRKYEAWIVPFKIDQVLVVVRDITGLDGAFAASPQSVTHLFSVFEDLLDALAIAQRGTLAFVNAALANLFGYPSPARLAGCSVLDLFALESRTGVERLMSRNTADQSSPSTYRARGLRCDGSTFSVEVRESVYHGDAKLYSVIRFRNITDPIQPAVQAHGTEATCRQNQTSLACGLTFREVQVLRMIAAGLSTKQVAATLGIAYKTADAHRTHIMHKLDVHETAGVVRCAIRFGLVEP
jgi:PAS domain S-box-containing protein